MSRGKESSVPVLRVLPGGADREDDKALARRVAAGDRDAAAQLYDRYVDRVDSTLYRILGRRENGHDDLVQSTFVQIVTSLGRFAGECSLATWVTRIAAHVAFNNLRSKKRSRAVFAADDEAMSSASVRTGDPWVANRVRRALAEITPEKAEAVVLHDMLGHDLAEVAALTGVTVAAAQSRLVRGRADLRAILDGDEGGAS